MDKCGNTSMGKGKCANIGRGRFLMLLTQHFREDSPFLKIEKRAKEIRTTMKREKISKIR